MFGFTEAEALGKTTAELLRPEYAPGEREGILAELAHLGAFRATIRLKHKSGADLMAEMHSTLLTDESGAISGYVVAYRDVTERKRMEEETRRLASFPLLNPQPVVKVDAAGRVSFANPSAQTLFPDLQQSGADHPWLADWKTLATAFDRAGFEPPGSRGQSRGALVSPVHVPGSGAAPSPHLRDRYQQPGAGRGGASPARR